MIKREENERKLELTLFPEGVLNSSGADALFRELIKAKDDIWCTVYIDLSGVPLASSEGFRMLIEAQGKYCAVGKKLVLRNPADQLYTGLLWTGIDRIMSIRKEVSAV